jgi:hypothetical protein
VGVIIGLLLVAYEIRISNRIGLEQANAAAAERWGAIYALGASPEIADIWVRAHEGDELSRAETFMLNSYADTAITAIAFDLTLRQTESVSFNDDDYLGAAQYYVTTETFKRRWPTLRSMYDGPIVDLLDRAIASPDQRDIVSYLDEIRGVTD